MPVVHVTRHEDVLRCYVKQVFLLRVHTCEMIMYCERLEIELWHVCSTRKKKKPNRK